MKTEWFILTIFIENEIEGQVESNRKNNRHIGIDIIQIPPTFILAYLWMLAMKKEVALFSNLYSQVKCLYIRDSFFANQGSYLWEYWLYFEKNKRWVAEKLALNGSAELCMQVLISVSVQSHESVSLQRQRLCGFDFPRNACKKNAWVLLHWQRPQMSVA